MTSLTIIFFEISQFLQSTSYGYHKFLAIKTCGDEFLSHWDDEYEDVSSHAEWKYIMASKTFSIPLQCTAKFHFQDKLFISNSTSIVFYIAIIVLFLSVRNLRINPMKRYWITLSAASLIKNLAVIGTFIIPIIIELDLKEYVILLLASFTIAQTLESFTFIWMLVICLKVFLTIK